MTTKDLQEGVRKRSIVLSFAVDGDFTFAPSTGFVLPDVLYNRHDSEKDRGRTTLCRFFGI